MLRCCWCYASALLVGIRKVIFPDGLTVNMHRAMPAQPKHAHLDSEEISVDPPFFIRLWLVRSEFACVVFTRDSNGGASDTRGFMNVV